MFFLPLGQTYYTNSGVDLNSLTFTKPLSVIRLMGFSVTVYSESAYKIEETSLEVIGL